MENNWSEDFQQEVATGTFHISRGHSNALACRSWPGLVWDVTQLSKATENHSINQQWQWGSTFYFRCPTPKVRHLPAIAPFVLSSLSWELLIICKFNHDFYANLYSPMLTSPFKASVLCAELPVVGHSNMVAIPQTQSPPQRNPFPLPVHPAVASVPISQLPTSEIWDCLDSPVFILSMNTWSVLAFFGFTVSLSLYHNSMK